MERVRPQLNEAPRNLTEAWMRRATLSAFMGQVMMARAVNPGDVQAGFDEIYVIGEQIKNTRLIKLMEQNND
jgi:hypothetical protein